MGGDQATKLTHVLGLVQLFHAVLEERIAFHDVLGSSTQLAHSLVPIELGSRHASLQVHLGHCRVDWLVRDLGRDIHFLHVGFRRNYGGADHLAGVFLVLIGEDSTLLLLLLVTVIAICNEASPYEAALGAHLCSFGQLKSILSLNDRRND